MAANLNIDELTRDERLDLIEALWDRLEMTEEQRRELDSRIEEMDRDESLGIPWNDMLRSIRKRV
jgi:putative addiction module component (TIGR02574 family)